VSGLSKHYGKQSSSFLFRVPPKIRPSRSYASPVPADGRFDRSCPGSRLCCRATTTGNAL